MSKNWHYYGAHSVKALLHHRPHEILNLFIKIDKHDDIADLAISHGISVSRVKQGALDNLFKDADERVSHSGVVALARAPFIGDEHDLYTQAAHTDNGIWVILDQVADPQNLGAILRTSAAMGVNGVVITRHHSAQFSPLVAKIAVGAMECVPLFCVSNLARAIDGIKDAGVFVYGTALDDGARAIWEQDFGGKVALVLGAEGDGARHLTLQKCDGCVYIPIQNVQSLNVGAAAAMALYEVKRSRTIK